MTAIFTSARAHYRQLTAEDWPFFRMLQQDSAVMRYVADARTEEAIRAAFESRLAPWYKGSPHWLCLLICCPDSGEPIGVTGFIDRDDDIAEVGFLLSAAFHGKGYGTESLRALARFAFEQQGYRKLTATVTAGNEASRRTLHKSGFVQEGTIRQNYFLQGQWRDDWIFGLLQAEFPG